MANTLANLKSALGAGARANKYRLNFSVPSTIATTSNLQDADILCKAARFPGMTIGPIEVWGQGRKLIIPGDTAYETEWAVTFYNTEDHSLRKDMIAWMKAADHFQNNSHSGNPGSIMTEMSVEQLDSAGNPTAKYTFHNMWVSGVAAVEVADETADTVQEFEVTFTFSDWVVGDTEFNVPSAGEKATLNDIAE